MNRFTQNQKENRSPARKLRAAQALTSVPRQASPHRESKPFCACGGGCLRCKNKLPLQTKIAVGRPGDAYEQEADRVAEKIMRMPEPAAARAPRELGAPDFAAGAFHDVGPGRPLDPAARRFFEPRFGRDFSGVRVHDDARAAESARSFDALAYTVGRDVVFGAAQYATGTKAGQKLLAHELGHVVQQGRGGTRERGFDGSDSIPLRCRSSPVLQRQESGDGETIEPEPAVSEVTRKEEILLSQMSPGGVTASADPPAISLYNFGINRAGLKFTHIQALNRLGRLLAETDHSAVSVKVVGHADDTGSTAINDPLSERRAAAVQKKLEKLSGMSVEVSWRGEDEPVATNDTVENRSLNRRAEIFIVSSAPPEETTDGKIVDGPGKERKKRKKITWDWHLLCFESGLEFVACAALLCALFPEYCIPEIPDIPDPPKKPKEPRACVKSFAVTSWDQSMASSPIYNGQVLQAYKLPAADKVGVIFNTNIEFIPDAATGCSCVCGEYQQEVKGWFKYNGVKKSLELANGASLSETTFEEDGNDDGVHYGYRINPGMGGSEQFLSNRATGCHYSSVDEPGAPIENPRDSISFELTFRAAPVESCPARAPVKAPNLIPGWGWLEWKVIGTYPPAPPTPSLPPPTTPTAPTPPKIAPPVEEPSAV